MKRELHPRNKHNNGYDFALLVKHNPNLKQYITQTPRGEMSIDFNDSKSVKELNKALLLAYYQLQYWDLPNGHLCPPIPGRVDYIHHIADLLYNGKQVLKSSNIKGLDIGVGANLIYPILGFAEYNWRFVGSDVNSESISWAKKIISHNPPLEKQIKIRRQKNKTQILSGIVNSQEYFDFIICNPPFHSSKEEALKSNRIKARKLKIQEQLNFGGVHSELWCKGGEFEFIYSMLMESEKFQTKILWFTCLVSKKDNLDKLLPYFKSNKKIRQYKIVDMAQGQKKSRFIAWTFLNESEIKQWKKKW